MWLSWLEFHPVTQGLQVQSPGQACMGSNLSMRLSSFLCKSNGACQCVVTGAARGGETPCPLQTAAPLGLRRTPCGRASPSGCPTGPECAPEQNKVLRGPGLSPAVSMTQGSVPQPAGDGSPQFPGRGETQAWSQAASGEPSTVHHLLCVCL